MQIHNLMTYENMPFEEYLSLPGFSYSGIKNAGVKIATTEKMRFGSLVDAYTFEPNMYSGEKFKLVRPVSQAVKEKLGPLLHQGKRQLVVTCVMVHRGLGMLYKGRVDLYAGKIVVDMKVSDLDLLKAINFFGYNNQVNGYALALGAQVSVIVSVHPKTYKVSTMAVPTKSEWWEEKVLQYGQPFVERSQEIFS